MTTSVPASPKLPANMARAVSMASSAVSAITTPLPAARPLALTTIGQRCARTQAASKVSRVKVA